jgi:hypothetical protein
VEQQRAAFVVGIDDRDSMPGLSGIRQERYRLAGDEPVPGADREYPAPKMRI